MIASSSGLADRTDDDDRQVFTLRLGGDVDKQFYALERAKMAEHQLARGRGDLKDRLTEAFTELIRIDVSALPAHLQSDYKWIKNSLTSKPAKQRAFVQGRWVEGVEGRIGATLAYMRWSKVEEIADRIIKFASQLEDAVNEPPSTISSNPSGKSR